MEFNRSEETIKINSELQIVKLIGKKFKTLGGYYMGKGYGLYHPQLGYFAFVSDEDYPYSPHGGKKTLKSILDAGGFTDFNNVKWLKEIK